MISGFVSSPGRVMERRVTCAHCGLAVKPAEVDERAEAQFCCAGCRAVFESIHACGLADYYRLREAAGNEGIGAAAEGRNGADGAFGAMDMPAFEHLYVEKHVLAEGREAKSCLLVLEGVTCGACVWLVERLPTILQGLLEARLSMQHGTVRVMWDPAVTSLSEVAGLLAKVGYKPHPARSEARDDLKKREARARMIDTAAAGALAGNIMLLAFALYAGLPGGMEREYEQYFRWLSGVLGVIALGWPGRTFFISSYRAIRQRAINLDVPITLALVAGGMAGVVNIVIGRGEIYFDSLSALVFLLLVGRQLQHAQQRRADRAVELLFSLMPHVARRLEGGPQADGREAEVIEAEVPTESLVVGDVVRVRPGELLPADGVVIRGASEINAAMLTGESSAVEVVIGDEVFGSAQNLTGVIDIRVTAAGEQTRAGRLMELVQRGVETRSPIVRHADRIGLIFTVVVTMMAVITFAGWATVSLEKAIDHSVAMLIVTCPCVLGLATPLTMAMSIGRLARKGVLVKSAEALEKLSHVGTLLLDKTGTLTAGRPVVRKVKWNPGAGIGEAEARGVLVALERQFDHPIARAVCEHFGEELAIAEVTDVQQEAGGISGRYRGMTVVCGSPSFCGRMGVEVVDWLVREFGAGQETGETVIMMAAGGRVVMGVSLADEVKPDAAKVLRSLRRERRTLAVGMITGDHARAAEVVARRLEIEPERVWSEVLPERKLALVQAAVAARGNGKGCVVMVGDGVNDAAALAAADVGVAVRGGAEASLAAADVYLSKPGLASLHDTIISARKTLSIIRMNLCLSLAYNVVAGGLTIAGMMHPLIAAILMPLSSLTVVTFTMVRIGISGDGKQR